MHSVTKNNYVLVEAPFGHPRAVFDHRRRSHKGQIYEHTFVAEQALGRVLPEGAEVHHVDRVRFNNANTNLVVCENRSYHRLLHVRTAAFVASGHADWRRCQFCKKHDDPANMYVTKKMVYHRDCLSAYRRKQRAR